MPTITHWSIIALQWPALHTRPSPRQMRRWRREKWPSSVDEYWMAVERFSSLSERNKWINACSTAGRAILWRRGEWIRKKRRDELGISFPFLLHWSPPRSPNTHLFPPHLIPSQLIILYKSYGEVGRGFRKDTRSGFVWPRWTTPITCFAFGGGWISLPLSTLCLGVPWEASCCLLISPFGALCKRSGLYFLLFLQQLVHLMDIGSIIH